MNQEWRPYHPDMTDQIKPSGDDAILMIARKTGNTYILPYDQVTKSQWLHMAGKDIPIAFSKKDENW